VSGFVPILPQERQQMLAAVGISHPESLFDPIPPEVRWPGGDTDPYTAPAQSEMTVIRELKALADKNASTASHACFLGAGAYDHYIPAAVDHIVSRQEFLTAYTPYQPEISQGTLQVIFEFQSLICRLTGLPIANSSMYDGASAAAEALLMTIRQTGRSKVFLAGAIHPDTRAVVRTYLEAQNFIVEETPWPSAGLIWPEDLSGYAGVLVQNPDFFGRVHDLASLVAAAHTAGALAVASSDPISLALLQPPGELGFDIAVGEAQVLGNSLSFGGPFVGYLAARESLLRKMPGRIAGETVDRAGRRSFVLTIQAREQHIRREKATSNICTSQALCALKATISLALLGGSGLFEMAAQSAAKAVYLQQQLVATGLFDAMDSQPVFREFAVRLAGDAQASAESTLARLNAFLLAKGLIGGLDLGTVHSSLAGCWLLAVTEKRTRAEIDHLVAAVHDFFARAGKEASV